MSLPMAATTPCMKPAARRCPRELPDTYALALCRIEPENNVHVILEALDGLEHAARLRGQLAQ